MQELDLSFPFGCCWRACNGSGLRRLFSSPQWKQSGHRLRPDFLRQIQIPQMTRRPPNCLHLEDRNLNRLRAMKGKVGKGRCHLKCENLAKRGEGRGREEGGKMHVEKPFRYRALRKLPKTKPQRETSQRAGQGSHNCVSWHYDIGSMLSS